MSFFRFYEGRTTGGVKPWPTEPTPTEPPPPKRPLKEGYNPPPPIEDRPELPESPKCSESINLKKNQIINTFSLEYSTCLQDELRNLQDEYLQLKNKYSMLIERHKKLLKKGGNQKTESIRGKIKFHIGEASYIDVTHNDSGGINIKFYTDTSRSQ